MSRKRKILSNILSGLLAALMSGCLTRLLAAAFGFDVSVFLCYGTALGAALLLRARGKLRAAAYGLVFLALIVVLLAGVKSVSEAFHYTRAERAGLFPAGRAFGAGAALFLALLFSLLLTSRSLASFALILLGAGIICVPASGIDVSLWELLPGIAAGTAVFALPWDSGMRNTRLTALLIACVLALLAAALVPSGGTTWGPLQRLAAEVRSVVENYTRFSEQRIVFSIAEKGFDHAALLGDDVVSMLGGPVNPDTEPVLSVETEEDLLLRGTVRSTYTGYSWTDDRAKMRYLYYDLTHAGVRGNVFGGAKRLNGFHDSEAKVTFLSGGTGTLFVPARLDRLDMTLKEALYYNSEGEVFITRDAARGDTYTVRTSLPEDRSAVLALAGNGHADADACYLQLPEGIISGEVYALASEITRNCSGDAEKAYAVEDYLAAHYSYSLDGGYPEAGDFVSWFLLEGKEGYCSHFAASMTVLCRMAGVPARYVEGYSVRAEEGGITTVTGENAHAWTEVYLPVLGWTPFDATAAVPDKTGGERSNGDAETGNEPPAAGDAGDDPGEDGEAQPPDDEPDNDPGADAPDDEPDNAPDDTPDDEPDNAPDDTPDDEPDDEPENEPDDSPEDEPEEENSRHPWRTVLIVLLILLLLAAAAYVLYRRLRATDPMNMIAEEKDAGTASLILCRACLTVLAVTGQTLLPSETLSAFARRVTQGAPNPAYIAFCDAVSAASYSGRETDRACVGDGIRAYKIFLSALSRRDRFFYALRRVRSGIGSTEQIP